MASDIKGETQEAPKTKSVVTRLTSLPLITSAYELLASIYRYAKETYPCVNTACNVAEMVAAVAMGGAKGGAQPLMGRLEPQIAAVNEYACKGLDKLEEKVPCLHQPAYQVIEEGVTLAKTVVGSTVNTAMGAANGAKQLFNQKVSAAVDLSKDIVQDTVTLTKLVVDSTVNTALTVANEATVLVSHRVADVVNLSKETAQESVDLTKLVVSSTVNTALQAAVGTKDLVVTGQVKRCGAVQEGMEMTGFIRQVMASGVDAMFQKTEEIVDYYLPVTEEELVKLAVEVQDSGPSPVEEQQCQRSYFVRLGSLSSKVRQRAYLHSLSRLNLVKDSTQETLSQLQLVINLIENLKQGVSQRVQEAQQKLHQLLQEWNRTQPGEAAEGDTPPEVESRILRMLSIVTQDLAPTYLRLVGSIEGLPASLRDKLDQTISNARQLHASFAAARSFQDLSSRILAQTREKIAQAREVLDVLVQYVAENTPLNWVVGPFRPSPEGKAAMEMEPVPPHDREMEARMEPGHQASGSEVTPKEAVTLARAEPRTEKKTEEAEGAGKNDGQMTAKGLVETWSEMPKRARKMKSKDTGQETAVEKPGKSALNQVAESHQKNE